MWDDPCAFMSRVGRELRRPVPTDPTRKARIMELVRASAAAGQPVGAPRAIARRGWVSRPLGVLLAASLATVATLGALGATGGIRSGGVPSVLDSLPGAESAYTLRDTLRLVRFMLAAPTASTVALAGDFNGWSRTATPLAAGRDGAWAVAVALSPGRHRYAFVVDDTQWVSDPAAPSSPGDSGRATSTVYVAARR